MLGGDNSFDHPVLFIIDYHPFDNISKLLKSTSLKNGQMAHKWKEFCMINLKEPFKAYQCRPFLLSLILGSKISLTQTLPWRMSPNGSAKQSEAYCSTLILQHRKLFLRLKVTKYSFFFNRVLPGR